MAEYVFEDRTIYAPQLESELVALSFGATKYAGFNAVGNAGSKDVTVHTTEDLAAAEEAELTAAILAHVPVDAAIDAAVLAAKNFGKDLFTKWNRVLIKQGLIQAGQGYVVTKALVDFIVMLNNGALYAADAELATVTPIATFLEQERIDEIRNEIRDYLGLSPV